MARSSGLSGGALSADCATMHVCGYLMKM